MTTPPPPWFTSSVRHTAEGITTVSIDYNSPKQYVAVFDYGDGEQMTVCTTDRMRKAVEDAAYSGEHDDARYFQFHGGRFVEVEFRCIKAGQYDSDDYATNRYGVFQKNSTRGAGAKAFDFFSVRIDGRA